MSVNSLSDKAIDVFRYYLNVLEEKYNISEAKSLLNILFEHFVNIRNLDLVKDPTMKMNASELLKIQCGVDELMKFKPIQYIVGYTIFLDFKFKVSHNVLIPRPETEELVKLIIQDFKKIEHPISILDIGTGSGCIAVTLSKCIYKSTVSAIDICEKAIKLARENAKLNHTKIKFHVMDIFNDFKMNALPMFDLVVSNPPYVKNSEKSLMQRNVLDYEPEKALFVSDENPLIYYYALAEFGKEHLNNKGKLYIEINEAFGKKIAKLLEEKNYSSIKIYKDINGKDRFISAEMITK